MLVVEAVSLQEGAVKTYNNILTEICLFLNPFPSFLKQDGHCDLKSAKIREITFHFLSFLFFGKKEQIDGLPLK